MHVQTQAFLRLLQSSFQVNNLMCYLHLCSQRYIVVHVELVDFDNDASLQHALIALPTISKRKRSAVENTQHYSMCLGGCRENSLLHTHQ